jgi:hypothetical protein
MTSAEDSVAVSECGTVWMLLGSLCNPALAMKWRLVVIAETAYVEATTSRRANRQVFSSSKCFFSYDIVFYHDSGEGGYHPGKE